MWKCQFWFGLVPNRGMNITCWIFLARSCKSTNACWLVVGFFLFLTKNPERSQVCERVIISEFICYFPLFFVSPTTQTFVWMEELIWLGCFTYSYCFYNDFFEYKNNKTVRFQTQGSIFNKNDWYNWILPLVLLGSTSLLSG